MWQVKEKTGLNIAEKQKLKLEEPAPVQKRDKRTRFYNVKVLKTNEQRVSKQNNYSHRNLNLYDSGTHSSMRGASNLLLLSPL